MASSLRGFCGYLEGIGPYLMHIMSHGMWSRLESWTTIVAGIAKHILKLHDRDAKITKSSSRLLNLPPELRNKIYEFALVESQEIQVHQQNIVKPPPLLACCRQIRSEALGLFFTGNNFRIWSQDCSGRLVLRWRRHFENYGRNAQGNKQTIGVALLGRPNWSNLLGWLKAQFDEGMLTELDPKNCRQREHMDAVWHSTNLMASRAQSAGRSWEEVEKDLEDLHSAVAACEPTWA